MMARLRPLFDAIFGPLDAALGAIPESVAPWAASALLIVPLLFVIRIPLERLLHDAPDTRRWRDLRIWAVVITLPYLLIYMLA